MEHQTHLYIWRKALYLILSYEQTYISNRGYFTCLGGDTYLFPILFSLHSSSLYNQNILSSRQESTYGFQLQWPLTGQAAFKKDSKGHSLLPGLSSYKSSAGHPPGPVSYPSRRWELVGCLGFFHDLGCIYASLFRSLSSLHTQGHVILVLSLTSPLTAWLSHQVWLARSTCFSNINRLKLTVLDRGNLSW